jgi:hypothetical protein
MKDGNIRQLKSSVPKAPICFVEDELILLVPALPQLLSLFVSRA